MSISLSSILNSSPRSEFERRNIDDRSARLQDAEESDRVMRRIGQVESDVSAWPNAELLEARRGAIGERLQLSVRNPLVHELQRRKRAEALSRRVEDALHRAEFDRPVPARAGRIGLQPGSSIHWFLSFPALYDQLALASLASDTEQVIVHGRCGLGIEADFGAKDVILVAEHQPLVLGHSHQDRLRGLLGRLCA